jgi:serine/threonine protein phosphatase 1
MRVLAIGDIHGCLQAFETLLDAVQPTPEDLLVLLGDYIDRGPDSRGVLERILRLKQTHRLVTLCGNHEQMMLEARISPEVHSGWLASGGVATLWSYGSDGKPGTLDDVPDEHWSFLEGCQDWLETERWLFVHANLDAAQPVEQQSVAILRWQKFDNPLPHMSGKTMICGHTRQSGGVPCNLGHAICIDTWVYGEGWLTCLEPSTGHLWQANQHGRRRELWVEDLVACD